ncbi:MAG: hypothetical protein R3F56_25735 [Planctomycetota bacterium]
MLTDLRFLSGVTALAITLPVSAQFTSPPGATQGSNSGNSSVLSTQPFAAGTAGRRFQYIVGDITAGAQTISQLSLQSDTSTTSLARNIDILLTMGHAPVGTALSPSTTFAANYVSGSETLVLDDGSGGHALQVSLPATPNGFDAIPIPLNHSFAYNGTDELIVDFDTINSTSTGSYSLDVESGTTTVSVGSFSYNGLVGCEPQGVGIRQDIFGRTPASSGGITTCSQYMDDGPMNSFGILSIGFSDPNSNFGGLLCAPLRAYPDIANYFVTTDANGDVGSSTSPIPVSFPDALSSFTFYTQFVIVDPLRAAPELGVSLSDGVKFDITPPSVRPRRMIYSTSSNTTTTGSSSTLYPPVMFFN